jgi:hypothetical protein
MLYSIQTGEILPGIMKNPKTSFRKEKFVTNNV